MEDPIINQNTIKFRNKYILLADHPTHKKYTPSNIQLNLLIPINTNSKTTQLSSLRLGDLFISVFQLAFGYLQSKLPGFIEPFLGTLQILFLLLTSRTQLTRRHRTGVKKIHPEEVQALGTFTNGSDFSSDWDEFLLIS